jgi:hypothetical protein
MKLSIKGLVLAGGTIWALFILVVGIFNIINPEYGFDLLKKLTSIYPGYKATGTICDLIVGLLYAFLDGAIWGLIFGLLYNVFAGKGSKKAAPRRTAARRAAPKKRAAAKKKAAGKKRKDTNSTGPRLR